MAFDGDGTLWMGDVGEDVFEATLARGDIREPAVEALRHHATSHQISAQGTGPEIAHRLYDAYRRGGFPEETICEVMTWCHAGWSRGEVEAFAREVIAAKGLRKRLHPEVVRVVDWLRAQGREVLLVSASPRGVIEVAADLVSITPSHVLAATARFAGDVMLPDVERPIPYGPGKVRALTARLGQRPLIAAFGDNAFDVAMLRKAHMGIAVRPKDRLRERASEVPGLVELARS